MGEEVPGLHRSRTGVVAEEPGLDLSDAPRCRNWWFMSRRFSCMNE
jgi:hypothetical protein